MVTLLTAADNWWAAWARAERWRAYCQDGRPEAERIFAEDFAVDDFNEDDIHDQLQFAEDALVESIREAKRSLANVELLRSVGAL